MTAFNPEDRVVYTRASWARVGTVREYVGAGNGHDYIIDCADGVAWFAAEDALTILPHGTPLFADGDKVRVRPDAPEHPGAGGVVAGIEFHGHMFGYWLVLRVTRRSVWIPAAALTAARKPVTVENILAIIPGAGDTTVAVIRDPEHNCFDVACSRCGRFHVLVYSPAATIRDKARGHTDIVGLAQVHAEHCAVTR